MCNHPTSDARALASPRVACDCASAISGSAPSAGHHCQSRAGGQMSCGGRTARSQQQHHQHWIALSYVVNNRADAGPLCACGELQLSCPQLLFASCKTATCDATHFRPQITVRNLTSTIWQIVHPLHRRMLANATHGKSFFAPLIRWLHPGATMRPSDARQLTASCCLWRCRRSRW